MKNDFHQTEPAAEKQLVIYLSVSVDTAIRRPEIEIQCGRSAVQEL